MLPILILLVLRDDKFTNKTGNNVMYTHGVAISVATGSSHLDYMGHLDHFLSGSKWV